MSNNQRNNDLPTKPIKKMLINATQKEELRVALIEGQEIYNLDREVMDHNQHKGNIYLAKIARLEASLDAGFIECGEDFSRHCFLAFKEVNREFYKPDYQTTKARPHIRDVLKQGQSIIVQVEKEERGNKGAALTTFISLAGCYVVLMPNSPKKGGVSRRVEGEEREELKDAINELKLPEGMSVIIRTAGVGRSAEELQWDLDVLLTQWRAIQEAAQQRTGPCLIYQESDVIIRALRDYLRPDISEIIIDTREAFDHAHEHIARVRPDFVKQLKFYDDPKVSLFSRYKIEEQIESAHRRLISLPNGGSIVIDRTEALVAIDVNSSKATEGGDIEETAFKTNLAAAKEIARQLRLRDLGGLIVIDFIDMTSFKNQRTVENLLREELKTDRARTRMGRLSNFGLLEMSRQRLRPSLGDSTQISCPRCEGQGTIRSVPSLALALMRVIEEESLKDSVAQLRIQVPIDVATFLINEKRDALITLENLHKISIIILPNPDFLTPHYEITRLRHEELAFKEGESSYQLTKKPIKTEENLPSHKRLPAGLPPLKPTTQMSAPLSRPYQGSQEPGIMQRMWVAIFGSSTKQVSSNTSIISRIWAAIFGANPKTETALAAVASRETREKEARRPQAHRNARTEHPEASRTRPNAPRQQDRRTNTAPTPNQPARKNQPQKNDQHRNTNDHRKKTHESETEIIDIKAVKPAEQQPTHVNINTNAQTREQKPVAAKHRTPTRPLRQSASHPENIQKMQAKTSEGVQSSSVVPPPSPTPASASASATPPLQKTTSAVCAIPSAPVCDTRRNKTGFTKLSDNDIQANFISGVDETPENYKASEPLKQVQSKHHTDMKKTSHHQPVIISKEFITDDLENQDK